MTRNSHLPLTETTTYVLLALTQPLHGYGAIQRIAELSNGAVKVAAGTMYGAIENLLKLEWIHEVPSADKRRRVYELTAKGRDILQQEVQRLRQLGNLATQVGY
ncbi:PadR family transcriptional regulator [Levilactobacillus acidifarinae]|uniref:Transcription regulator PadR N-terminal domain-containing protein n=1 Tax=Levilactobacillus acidifarinae DSM 19394 = JCM 15949 TaxID=1423715 RepID=A0A0R1LGM1_9LACO|nr:helix-turn-helix transcriptional regulator [Levilactobacillus acidifarinae]KRK95030.1 hypothetical protein FD25_GL002216 [Levilactobacillus acidifarinae DSM 19394]GEO70576.1 transcriptional regulator [Levilactobacillus acidifarinae]